MIRYVSSIHWSDTRYVSYHLLNTNIAETVIKLKSHMFHANIEAGIEHVCNIGNRNFQKFPLAFRAGQFVDDIFYWDLLWQSSKSKNWSRHNTRPQSYDSLTVIRVMCTSVHVQRTSTSQCYQKMESQHIEFTFEEYPLLNMVTLYRRHNKLN